MERIWSLLETTVSWSGGKQMASGRSKHVKIKVSSTFSHVYGHVCIRNGLIDCYWSRCLANGACLKTWGQKITNAKFAVLPFFINIFVLSIDVNKISCVCARRANVKAYPLAIRLAICYWISILFFIIIFFLINCFDCDLYLVASGI